MTSQQTPEQRIDAALDSVLRASGSALRHYTLPGTLQAMRDAMRRIMVDSYIQGSDAARRAMTGVNGDHRAIVRAAAAMAQQEAGNV